MVDVSSSKNSITIKVESTNKTNSITTTPSAPNNSVTTKSDTAQYWSNVSRDYSEQAKTSAYKAEQVKNEIITQKDSIIADIENTGVNAVDNIATIKSESIADIEAKTNEASELIDTGIADINSNVDASIANINNTVNDGIADINNTKTNIITDIEFVADGEKEEIREIIDTGKEELQESIGNVKILTTLEIGDIGIAPLGIDETQGKRRYLNGQLIIQEQYVQFTNKVKSAVALYPSLACTESEWQTTATMTVGGQVGKFVVDNDAGTIRLPKIIMPIQGLTDLSKLGEIVEAGLPNITGQFDGIDTYSGKPSGAFYEKGTIKGGTGGGTDWIAGFDASLSNPIYNNSDTVQQEQIQYPYFIQVATGVETEGNIINEIELNNPYSLLDIKWSDKILNNISWLRSGGQANSKAIYNDVYELILREYNSGTDETEIIGGISITFRRGVDTNIKVTTDKLAYDNILSATGTAWYYVIDTANETFYLPQSDGFLQFGGNGDFVEAGLPNITGTFMIELGTAGTVVSTGAFYNTGQKGGSWSEGHTSGSGNPKGGFDASRSSSVYKDDVDTVQPNAVKGYLYFYVGETVQNANLINAGRIEEKITEALAKPHIVETYKNGTSWYRIYSDGWCEQGGISTKNASSATIKFLKPFKDTNYSITATYSFTTTTLTDTAGAGECPSVGSYTTTSFYVSQVAGANTSTQWEAKGYIA